MSAPVSQVACTAPVFASTTCTVIRNVPFARLPLTLPASVSDSLPYIVPP